MGNYCFDHICHPEQNCGIKWCLAKFVTLSKTMANDYFDHVCHTEQRYGRSDNLTSFTTLGETQVR